VYRDRQVRLGQGTPQMGRHVVRPLVVMFVRAVFRRETGEIGFEVAACCRRRWMISEADVCLQNRVKSPSTIADSATQARTSSVNSCSPGRLARIGRIVLACRISGDR
jgi:hypothetical protein